MTDHQIEVFLCSLQQLNTNLAQLVLIQQQRFQLENMTPQIVNALIAALSALTALMTTSSANAAVLQAAKDKAVADLAALQATDAALQDPALVSAANAAIAAAVAVEPVVSAPVPSPAPAA